MLSPLSSRKGNRQISVIFSKSHGNAGVHRYKRLNVKQYKQDSKGAGGAKFCTPSACFDMSTFGDAEAGGLKSHVTLFASSTNALGLHE